MNKRNHIINGGLVGIVVGALLSPTWDIWMLRSIGAVTVPVTVGVLVPEIVSELGQQRKPLHNVGILGGFVVFPFVFGTLPYVWIGVGTNLMLAHLGTKRGIAGLSPSTTNELNLPTGAEMVALAPTHVASTEEVPLLDDETVLEQRHPSWLNWEDSIAPAVCFGGIGVLG